MVAVTIILTNGTTLLPYWQPTVTIIIMRISFVVAVLGSNSQNKINTNTNKNTKPCVVEGVNITLCSSGHTLGSRPEQHHCLNVWKSNAHMKPELILVDNHHYHQYLHPPQVIRIIIIMIIMIITIISIWHLGSFFYYWTTLEAFFQQKKTWEAF